MKPVVTKCFEPTALGSVQQRKWVWIKSFNHYLQPNLQEQGTGLGLSLAYDIITKEHNGTIKVESKEGEGSIFIINLPVA